MVIVGGGLAGLACADLLHRHGIRADLYEARPDRLGGRCWSSHGWHDGQVAEHGGEFIDTRHHAMRRLVRRFDLRLDDTWDVEGGSSRYWLRGDRRVRADFVDDVKILRRRLRRLARRIGPYYSHHPTQQAREVDEQNARELLARLSPGGVDGLAGRWADQFLTSFLGLDAVDLSALALVDNLTGHVDGADERYHIRGGNDQVVAGLVDTLPSHTITMDAPLTALHRRADGRVALRFAHHGLVVADQVVLCLPFTTLREVDLDGAGLSTKKLRCIRQLGMGTNAKVLFQLEQRPQSYGGWNGYLSSDRPALQTWESSRAQPGTTGLMTAYLSGRSGGRDLPETAVHGVAPVGVVDDVLRAIARGGRTGIDGLRQGYLGRARIDHWSQDRWTRGSYAAFLPGQYTRFAGSVGEAEGNVHFAGEHTAPLRDQGYLDGAVRTGLRAAQEVMSDLGLHRKTHSV